MVKTVSMVFGVIFILIGVLGFVQFGATMEADPTRAPHLLGLFPVNAVHNGVHVGLGLWGVLAARSWAGARNYCRIAGILYLLLAVLGFVAPSGFGLVPLGGHDIWLHLVLGVVLSGVGFAAREETVVGTRVA
jgi:hypothetical protein